MKITTMRLPISLFALAATALAAPAAVAGPAERTARRAEAALAGRVPGKPVSCINTGILDRSGGTTISQPDRIIYKLGGRVFVNRPRGGCPFLREDRYFVSSTPSSQLCSGDIISVRDPGVNISVGSCAFGEFVPYERPGRDDQRR